MKAADKHAAIAEQVVENVGRGQPTLVGTASVEESDRISSLLRAYGVEHRVLNAVHHHEEAQVVAKAGEPAAVTVATNMAGRGTDIKLPQKIIQCGGLYVIAATRNIAARIDRQLAGRCARQGQPGTVGVFVSFEDDLIRQYLPVWLVTRLHRLGRVFPGWWVALAQRRSEGRGRRQRAQVLRSDDQTDQQLGFAKDYA